VNELAHNRTEFPVSQRKGLVLDEEANSKTIY